MAVKSPKQTRATSESSTRQIAEERPPLPQPMPIQYHETIQESWRGHQIPNVPPKDERPHS